MRKHYIVGAAGHVDHGKTTLLKALTGIDTDRLPEEKARGLSIDLGFAHLDLSAGVQVGLVDVPGHERFLKNMLAGVGGYDAVLLVVDALEGVRPQTREHLQILDLLRTPAGVVALTKVDLVDPDQAGLIETEVRGLLQGTLLQEAPIVRVSGVTGSGLEALKQALDGQLAGVPCRDPEGPFRLPVDRAFVRPGFGTVVTGSLWSGRLRLGDPVEVLPSGLRGRVRGLQVHGQVVSQAVAGQRVAVNVAGVEPGQLHRGLVLAPPGWLTPTQRLDVRLQTLADLPRPLANQTRIRFYAGTSESLGRVLLLEEGQLGAGGSALAQLVLERTVVALPHDRFVIRDFTARSTLGGGEILDPSAPSHRRLDAGALAGLRSRETGGAAQAVVAALDRASGGARTPGALAQDLQLPAAEAQALVEALVASGQVQRLGRYLVLAARAQPIRQQISEVLGRLAQAAPWKVGWRKEELLRLLNAETPRLAEEVLADCCRRGDVVDHGGLLALRDHRACLSADQQRVLERVEEVLIAGGFSPPDWEDVPFLAEVEPRLWRILEAYLLETGRAIRLAPRLVFLQSVLEQGRQRLAQLIRAQGPVTASQAREALQTTRKFLIPLLEFYDRTHFTRRAGDLRHLGESMGTPEPSVPVAEVSSPGA